MTKESGCDIIEKLVCKRLAITEKVFWKNFEKKLDKRLWKWYNIKAALRKRRPQKEKFEKTSEKGLTNELECGIIKKLTIKWENSILKIKQCKESITTLEIPMRNSEGQAKTLKRSNNASVIEQDWYLNRMIYIYYLIKSLILAQDERWRHA